MEHRNIKLIELKGQIEKAIRGHVSQMSVPKGTTQNDVYQCIRSIMRENPDIFWYAYQWKYLEQKNTIQLEYIFPKSETEEIKGKINDVINNDFQIDYVCTLSKWEKVMYVYKWIISNCNYNLGSAYNQCIYSVFVLRNSVCSGYSKAAQYLFKLLDFDSILVYGKLKGSEDGSKHCWNLIDIDGKQYHLDVSFGDTALNSLLIEMGVLERMKIDEINYNFFCVSSQEIQKSRIIFELDDLPEAKNTLSFLEIEKLSQIQLMLRQSDKSILLSTKGTTAEIYLCSKDKNTVLKCYRDTSSNHCWEEYRFMDRLRGCPHLLHVNDKYCDIGNGVIALEQAVPVSEIIKSLDNVFTLKDALFMIRDIALAVDECYWYNTYYRDIHLNNIYKTSDGLYKLADFGSCSWVIQTDALFVKENVEGSPWFMAPETYENGVFDLASATYSLSLLLYFVLNDLTPPFWNEYYDKRAYQKRYEGEPIPSLLLDFDEDVSKEIVSFLEKGLAFNEADRYKGMHAYISNIENLIDILGKRDFSLQLSKDESFFNRTVYPRFHEGCCTTGVNSVSFDENEEDFVPTEITCPNCNHVYLVELAKELYKNIRPMLCSDSANGGLSIIRKDTDYVTCPNCSYKVSIGECIENHIISLPLKNNCYQKEDFSTTFIHTRKNACTYFPTCIFLVLI